MRCHWRTPIWSILSFAKRSSAEEWIPRAPPSSWVTSSRRTIKRRKTSFKSTWAKVPQIRPRNLQKRLLKLQRKFELSLLMSLTHLSPPSRHCSITCSIGLATRTLNCCWFRSLTPWICLNVSSRRSPRVLATIDLFTSHTLAPKSRLSWSHVWRTSKSLNRKVWSLSQRKLLNIPATSEGLCRLQSEQLRYAVINISKLMWRPKLPWVMFSLPTMKCKTQKQSRCFRGCASLKSLWSSLSILSCSQTRLKKYWWRRFRIDVKQFWDIWRMMLCPIGSSNQMSAHKDLLREK